MNKNMNVAIVAPSAYAQDTVALARGIALLEQQGCRIYHYHDTQAKYQRFAADDRTRISQFMAAVHDPDVEVILALRGGYGASRILSALDWKVIADSGKLLVGHSDFTAIQMALLAQTGAMSFAGPMVCDDFTREDVSDFTMQNMWNCLKHSQHVIVTECIEQENKQANNPVFQTSGQLWGGNLTMLVHMLGTPYFPQIDGGILFVEDVNEHPYRVERMLLQLLHAGVLEKQKALLLGDFSRYRLSDYDNGYDFDAMLAYLRAHLSLPILTGLPFGHIRDKVTLAVGCQAELIAQKEVFQLSMTGYPSL